MIVRFELDAHSCRRSHSDDHIARLQLLWTMKPLEILNSDPDDSDEAELVKLVGAPIAEPDDEAIVMGHLTKARILQPRATAVASLLLLLGLLMAAIYTVQLPSSSMSVPYRADGNGSFVEVVSDRGWRYNVTSTAAAQIQSFRDLTGLMVNVHVTHHGGTTFCGLLGKMLGAPSFACLENRNETIHDQQLDDILSKPWGKRIPWSHNETAENIATVRKYFRMISFEYSPWPPGPLSTMNWEHVNLTSVYIIRHPLSRMLAHDAWTHKSHPTVEDGTADNATWMDFARKSVNADNYALHVLSDNGCCNGSATDPKYLEEAKELVSRFTFVLDIGCLDTSMLALADLLGFQDLLDTSTWKPDVHHDPPGSRIPAGVYEYLVEKNRLDLELYEFAKARALVDCSSTTRAAFDDTGSATAMVNGHVAGP